MVPVCLEYLKGRELTEDETTKANYLGWCIEFVSIIFTFTGDKTWAWRQKMCLQAANLYGIHWYKSVQIKRRGPYLILRKTYHCIFDQVQRVRGRDHKKFFADDALHFCYECHQCDQRPLNATNLFERQENSDFNRKNWCRKRLKRLLQGISCSCFQKP